VGVNDLERSPTGKCLLAIAHRDGVAETYRAEGLFEFLIYRVATVGGNELKPPVYCRRLAPV
jgi:hypothetical protein